MNKELLELLNSINEKKEMVRNLVEDGKLEDAKSAKAELEELHGGHLVRNGRKGVLFRSGGGEGPPESDRPL